MQQRSLIQIQMLETNFIAVLLRYAEIKHSLEHPNRMLF